MKQANDFHNQLVGNEFGRLRWENKNAIAVILHICACHFFTFEHLVTGLFLLFQWLQTKAKRPNQIVSPGVDNNFCSS
jgi:hypothetical protein